MKRYPRQDFDELLKSTESNRLKRLLSKLLDVIDAERGCFWLESTKELIYAGDQTLRETFPFSKKVFDNVLEHGNGFVTFDPVQDERMGPTSSMAMHNMRSALAAAARDSQGQISLIAYFDNKMTAPAFCKEDLAFLQEILDNLGDLPESLPTSGV